MRRGAYGLALEGANDVPGLVEPAPDAWETWTLDRGGHGAVATVDHVFDVAPNLRVTLRRADRRIRLVGDAVVDPATIAHPLLTGPGLVCAGWRGATCLHAGAVVAGGGAWGVLGGRGSGKSTLLAALAASGALVLCDDLLVLEGADVLCGPAFVDLRETAGAHFGGQALGRIGGRDRWRLAVVPAPAAVPLSGWIVLDWGAPAEEAVPPGPRAAHIGAHASSPLLPERLLELARLPMWRHRRPADLDGALAHGIRLRRRLEAAQD